MGSAIEPLIRPWLERSIRCAYLEELDANWAEFGQRFRVLWQRSGHLAISSLGAFRRLVERFRAKLTPQVLSSTDIGVASSCKRPR